MPAKYWKRWGRGIQQQQSRGEVLKDKQITMLQDMYIVIKLAQSLMMLVAYALICSTILSAVIAFRIALMVAKLILLRIIDRAAMIQPVGHPLLKIPWPIM